MSKPYTEVDIGDRPDTIHDPRSYLVPHDDGVSIMYRDPMDGEREIFLTTREALRLATEVTVMAAWVRPYHADAMSDAVDAMAAVLRVRYAASLRPADQEVTP